MFFLVSTMFTYKQIHKKLFLLWNVPFLGLRRGICQFDKQKEKTFNNNHRSLFSEIKIWILKYPFLTIFSYCLHSIWLRENWLKKLFYHSLQCFHLYRLVSLNISLFSGKERRGLKCSPLLEWHFWENLNFLTQPFPKILVNLYLPRDFWRRKVTNEKKYFSLTFYRSKCLLGANRFIKTMDGNM